MFFLPQFRISGKNEYFFIFSNTFLIFSSFEAAHLLKKNRFLTITEIF